MNKLLVIIIAFLLFYSCEKQRTETPTKGYLKCYVDESLYNLIYDEADLFMNFYKDAKIDLIKVKAREGIASIFNNEAEMFVSSRQLNKEEMNFIKNNHLEININKFCYDGIAVIGNRNFPNDKIQLQELIDLMANTKNKIKVIIPEKNSGIYEYVISNLTKEEDLKNVEIVLNEIDVIDKVRKNNNIIGLIGLNNLKNIDDVKILKIGVWDNSINGISYYYPHPGYLVNASYPLQRTNYILLREIGTGLATGFTSFLTSNEGQTIVMKNNLGPATVPVKLIQLD